ncbi:MAG TPA: redoxin domain-containing protein, partial [Saprospiraceae bacterium]|nr:redoxin domain-containing protein [Saprospiraceae bacterium]
MKKLIFAASISVLSILLVAAVWKTDVTNTESAILGMVKGVKVGDRAPEFKLKNVKGETISFDSYKDAKGYIITFTCNHCPYAIMYEDRLIALHKKYAPLGYPVIA